MTTRATIFDPLRHKRVTLTPEEGVRQSFVRWLIEEKGYPAPLLANEVSLKVGKMVKRCDTVAYDNEARPLMIVEYKAPTVGITQRTFDQVARYNIALRVRYLVMTNGCEVYCCSVDYDSGTVTFLRDVPCYEQISGATSLSRT